MKFLSIKRLELVGEDGSKLTLGYSNQGDPYRQGISVELYTGEFYGDTDVHSTVFVEDYEAVKLRDKLLELYPLKEAI